MKYEDGLIIAIPLGKSGRVVGAGRSTMFKAVAKGELRVARLSRRKVVVRLDELRRWLLEREEATNGTAPGNQNDSGAGTAA